MSSIQSRQNYAAWLDAPGKQLRIAAADYPKPQAGQVTIRNYALAINPIDRKIQDRGLWKEDFPSPLGFDMAGEVVELGQGVNHVKVGDRVAAFVPGFGHQLYVAPQADDLGILPSNISYIEGAIFPVAFQTALVGLCSEKGAGLGLPYPSLHPRPLNKILVVWGGSSSVGAMVIQIAKAIGLTVIATASEHNFELCKTCGADQVFSYKSKTVVNDIVKTVKDSGIEIAGFYDCIAEPVSLKPVDTIIDALGGASVIVLDPLLEPSENANIHRIPIRGAGPVPHPAYRSYFTEALRQGKLKPLPPPYVVGKGLEFCQAGIDMIREGVSAKKLVIDLSE